MDGVSETKSTTVSLDVYSIKFDGCRDIYPVKIVRPLNKFQIDNREQFSQVLRSVLSNNLILKAIVADNPKRSFVKFTVQHSGRFSCEYCFEPGVTYSTTPERPDAFLKNLKDQKSEINSHMKNLLENNGTDLQIEALRRILKNIEDAEKMANKKKPSHIVWPSHTMDGIIRTKEKIVQIANDIEAGIELTPAQKKGIKGKSPLLEIEYFDFIFSVPAEYMHLISLGVVKRLIELCFSVGENRQRITKTPITSPVLFNELMKKIKYLHEFSRRARRLDLSVMKAQELRNVLIFYFPIVTKCLEKNDKEIKIWQMLAFMVRSCIIPDNEFLNVNINSVKYCQKQFYNLYEQLYGPKNCTYSIHVAISHVLHIRKYGPLTETSAFRFESFYAELRRSFQPGSVSVVKQMFQNILLKRILAHHVCSESIYYSAKDTALECNSLIYVYQNNSHLIYKILSIEDENFICNQMGNHEIDMPLTSMLNWSSVGVYRKGGLSSENVTIKKENVAGKVMCVEKHLITCPVNILREK